MTQRSTWITAWRPLRKGSLLGFARVEHASGLVINDVQVCRANGSVWANPPGKPMVSSDDRVLRDDRGKVRYAPVIEFTSKVARDRWSDGVVEAMRIAHPETLHDEGAS